MPSQQPSYRTVPIASKQLKLQRRWTTARLGLAGVTVSLGVTGLAAWTMSSSRSDHVQRGPAIIAQADGRGDTGDATPQASLTQSTAANPSGPSVIEAPSQQPAEPVRDAVTARREAELARIQQQAQQEFEQSAAEYDAAVQMWNAEVAACQAAPVARYTPNQMGRFAAMGVRMDLQQQRQPNQAILQAARQAEQRFLQARDNYQRLTGNH